MDELEFEFTLKNILIFLVALGAGALSAYFFPTPWIGFFIIIGAVWYLIRKKS